MVEAIALAVKGFTDGVSAGFNFFATKDTNKANVKIALTHLEISKVDLEKTKVTYSGEKELATIGLQRNKEMMIGIAIIVMILGSFVVISKN